MITLIIINKIIFKFSAPSRGALIFGAYGTGASIGKFLYSYSSKRYVSIHKILKKIINHFMIFVKKNVAAQNLT